MRTEILMRVVCIGCGSKMSTETRQEMSPDTEYKLRNLDLHEFGDPIGAHTNYLPVFVRPCRTCIEVVTTPANSLVQALKALTKESL